VNRAVVLVALVACSGGGERAPREDAAAAERAAGRRSAPPRRLTAADVVPPGLRLPEGVAPVGYAVELTIDPGLDRFTGAVQIKLALDAPADHVWLHAVDLDLDAIEVRSGMAGAARAGAIVPIAGDEMIAIDLGGAVPAGITTLSITYSGAYHDAEMVGLFRADVDGKRYVYSQLEAVHARKVVPCLDEPRFKVPWQVTLRVPKDLVALGNAPVARRTDDGDAAIVELVVTDPLPSYLIALAVGPFAVAEHGTVGARKLPLRVVAPAGARAADSAYAAAAVARMTPAFEAYFARPLPYAKLDLVAVPGFPGAMENPGLVTFDSELLFARTPDDRADLVEIIAHELAHQWFGNLVTLAWWDDLWLNESFANWLGAKIAADLVPGRDVAVAHHAAVETAMAADLEPDAAALRRTIRTNADIEAAFDAIAYDKGAAVLAMFEAWIGEAKVKDAMRAYVEAHAGGVSDSSRFLDAIEAVSDAGVRGAFATFVDRPGVPLISLERRCDVPPGQGARIAIAQERLVPAGSASPLAAWQVPVCVRYPTRGRPAIGCAMLAGPTAELVLPAAAGCPAWIIGNADDRGYYRVRADARMLPPVRQQSPRERLGAAGDAEALVVAGRGDPVMIAALVPALIASKSARDERAAIGVVTATAGAVADARRPAWQRWARRLIAPVLARARIDARAPGDATQRAARAERLELAALVLEDARLLAEARALATRWLAGDVDVPADELEVVLAAAARAADPAFAEQLLIRRTALEGPERDAVVHALGGVAEVAAADRAFTAVVETDPVVAADVATLIRSLAERAATRALVLDRLRDRRAALVARLAPDDAAHALIEPFAAICDAGERGRALPVLEAVARDVAGGAEVLAGTLAVVDACIARRAAMSGAFDLVLGP
jgi:alanyl aminopeptidase